MKAIVLLLGLNLFFLNSYSQKATTCLIICINDQPELDFAGKRNPDGQGFAAFGKVTKGMKVVKTIQAQKEKDQYQVNPVVIYSIRRID